jgi:hypothetical protein
MASIFGVERYAKLETALLATCFRLVSYLAYSSILKMEATCSSKLRLTYNELHGVVSQKI